MPELPRLTEAEQTRTESALTIVRFILKLPVLHARAVQFNMPLGTVLGPKQSLLELDLASLGRDVNASIAAIGGIPAKIESEHSVTHIDLIQWLGPQAQDPAMHHWVGQVANDKAHISAPIRGVEEDLLNSL